MLDKTNILQHLKAFKWRNDQYCVMTGAALVLHGVKEYTEDIDIGCSEELFDQLLQQGYMPKQLKSFEGIVIGDCIEVFRNWQAEKIVFIDELPVADIYSIRKFKQQLGRDKDIKDIALINEYIAANEK